MKNDFMGDMPDPIAARKVAGITCHHLPRLVIGSENGYICCECWALEEQARAQRAEGERDDYDNQLRQAHEDINTLLREIEQLELGR